jgi:diguanylate cyclase (GGDEF)-like protein
VIAVIEIRTLLALAAATDIAIAAILWAAAGRRLRYGMAEWISALMLRATGIAVLALEGAASATGLAVSAGLLALAITLQGAALIAYDGRHLPAWVHGAVLAAVAVPLGLLASDPANAVLFGGLVIGTLLAVLAGVALQVHAPLAGRGRARGVLVATFAVGAVAFYSRGVSAILVADPLHSFVQPNAFQSALFIAAFAAAIASSFGFMLLHKERAEGEAVRMATMDPLTGAYNRRTFHEIAEREMSRARRAGQPLSIILIDIDHFRPINERHGHRTGDAMLARMADVIRGALRKEDMLVRYGGEEFLVLLPDVPGPGAVVVAGRIRKAVEAEPFQLGGNAIAATVSVGVSARLDEGPESIEGLLARADEALALAKQRGRNRVVALSLGRSIAA